MFRTASSISSDSEQRALSMVMALNIAKLSSAAMAENLQGAGQGLAQRRKTELPPIALLQDRFALSVAQHWQIYGRRDWSQSCWLYFLRKREARCRSVRPPFQTRWGVCAQHWSSRVVTTTEASPHSKILVHNRACDSTCSTYNLTSVLCPP